jgi:CHASE2 domain-containing sensor protein
MNEAVHQLLQLILQGLAWFLRTIETLWVWSWSQIAAVQAADQFRHARPFWN